MTVFRESGKRQILYNQDSDATHSRAGGKQWLSPTLLTFPLIHAVSTDLLVSKHRQTQAQH
ncbi:MAG: hypothetical protein IKM68_06885 [Bacteroidaceae bacterium]|nr:hypothetical protein [Bacteroidaceae bacterium]